MPLARIEDMAARYIAEIRCLQPTGPYRLGGYSMGGLIAYEMARQLRAAGEAVELLALFDTYPHEGLRRQGVWHVFEQGNRLSGRTPAAVMRYLRQGSRNLALAGRTALWRRLFGVAWRLHEMRGTVMPDRLRRPIAANYLAIRRYRIKPYAGDAVLFAAGRYPWERADALEGWRALIGGSLRVRTIPGVHHEIVDEPHVRILAQELSDALGESRAGLEDLAAVG
jgi:acetoacetyl-CoA synthetase